jgi:hypothetical protein
MVLMFELRASCLLGRHSTTYVKSPVLLVSVIFQIGSHTFCLGLTSDHHPPTYASLIAGITGACHCSQLAC